jgi:predicted nucleotidyltransferase
MRIDPKETIAGIPILDVRKLLRRTRTFGFTEEYVKYSLKLSTDQAAQLIDEMASRGLIKEDKPEDLESMEFEVTERYWENTMAGNRLALATAAKPIKRSTAEKAIKGLLERVEELNSNPHYLWKVDKVIVFGSYLSGLPMINDVDIALEITTKENDLQIHNELRDKRIHEAKEGGKKFRSYLEELFWPFNEVVLFLKSRSRTLSLHPVDSHKDILKNTAAIEIYPDVKLLDGNSLSTDNLEEIAFYDSTLHADP